jgi:hypothetical protein
MLYYLQNDQETCTFLLHPLSLYMQITIFILQLKLEEGGGAQALSLHLP